MLTSFVFDPDTVWHTSMHLYIQIKRDDDDDDDEEKRREENQIDKQKG